jgi:tagaturonate reductase
MLKKLNHSTAQSHHERPVRILQFGEGNFLRAFVDWMVDILNEKTDFNSAVQVIQPISKGMGKMLNQQDGLYHVLLKGIVDGKETSNTRLIRCITSCINPYEEFQLFLKTAENPGLKFIVSNTTEAGIAFNPSDSNPEILAESFPGKVTQLLYHRFKFYDADNSRGLIFLPCELIEKNGENLKQAIVQVANHWNLSQNFIRWVNDANVFCNTLVDRIVPGFPRETIQDIHESIGYEDNLLVQAEPFHLWVIEGPSTLQQQLPVAKAGLNVKFVSDITPYRTRKVRILNGAHTAMVPVAYLTGFRTVRQSVEDPSIGRYIRNTIFNEIIPTLDLPHEELNHFANDVMERFQNPFIKHELLSIALNSISKYKVRVLPSVLEYKNRTGQLPKNLLYSLAALIRFYKGEWNGEAIPVNDAPDVLEFFSSVWKSSDIKWIATEVLSSNSFWGEDLNKVEGFTELITLFLKQIDTEPQLLTHRV